MEAGTNVEKDCSALGQLFQAIINDLRGGTPVWEDFTYKATKLHSSLKTTLIAISAFLDAFQKIADLATGSRGATKEIGSALTRLCMRHHNIESKLKTFTNSILDSLVVPIQEKLEDWKKVVAQLDKDHAKEYRRARQEIKKAASDTMKLQKKVKKGKGEMQSRLENAMHDVNDKYLLMEECEKNFVRTALIEERGRFCVFIGAIKPFVNSEIALLSEVTHLQETIDSLCNQAAEPQTLPTASEQVILDVKGVDYNIANFQKNSPPSSPSSLGSRKSSMCSINSITSSSSGSIKSHSPSHQNTHMKSIMQPMAGTLRLNSVSSQDSGFTSQDTLFLRPATPQSLNILQNFTEKDIGSASMPDPDSTPTTPSEHYPATPSASSTWNNWPNQPTNACKSDDTRPHTISTAYERSHHNRPALNADLFEPPPPGMLEKPRDEVAEMRTNSHGRLTRPHSTSSNPAPYSRPSATINKMQPVLPPLGPKPKSKAVPPPMVPCIEEQPIYANASEMAKSGEGATDKVAGSPDSDTSATTTPTPSSNGQTQQPLTESDMLNLQEAIKSLDSCTAALNDDYDAEADDVGSQRKKMQKNSLELAEAIRELEASTAALESTYDEASYTSHTSLQCSSGYGTMNSTPSGSEDTIASGDFSVACTQHDHEKYYTIPRSRDVFAAYHAFIQPKRPASTAGIPVSQAGNGVVHRGSVSAPKPPPPVRRTASMSAGSGAVPVKKTQASAPKPGPVIQHRRTHSASNSQMFEGPYAELQLIQESIHTKTEQDAVHHPQPQPPPPPPPSSSSSSSSSAVLKQYLANQSVASYHHHSANQSQPSACAPHHHSPVVTQTLLVGGVTYAVPNMAPNAGTASTEHASVIQSLNAKFSELNQQQQQQQQQHGGGGDDVDFPLPPTEDELREIEKLYSKPPPVHPKPPDSAVIMELKRRVASDTCSSDV